MAQAPPIRVLTALESMVDEDVLLITSSGSGGQQSVHLSLRPTLERPHPGFHNGLHDIAPTIARGLFARDCCLKIDKDAMAKALGLLPGTAPSANDKAAWAKRPPFAWYETAYEVSDQGRRLLEEHRETLAEWRKTEAEKPQEFIAILTAGRGAKGVGAWCRVIRRTEKRVYLEIVDHGQVKGSTGRIEGGSEKYVAVEDIFPEEIDHATWKRLAEATRERQEAQQRAEKRLHDKIMDLRNEWNSQERQIDAQFEDEISEIVGRPGRSP